MSVVAWNMEFSYYKLELCADELVVGGGVGWSYDRRRAVHFSSAAAAASDRMREQ